MTAQFFGHTHTDEFEIFYDMKDNSRPFGIGYLGPSATTFTYMNPGYRVYYVDGDYEGTTRVSRKVNLLQLILSDFFRFLSVCTGP